MPQLHLYVPEPVAAEIGRKAKERGVSVSRYLAEIVRRDLDRAWPAGFFEDVVGGWKGEALARPPEDHFETRDEL
ncbi:MAG: hypothetical protein AB1578_22170 [Thermodesulfobacteriota bacterium]